jgi:hypothetical protein
MGDILYVDERPTPGTNSFDEAKKLAKQYIKTTSPLRIESFVAPERSQIWIYDHEINDWVEQR